MRFVHDVSNLNRLFCRYHTSERCLRWGSDQWIRDVAPQQMLGGPCIGTARRASPSRRNRFPTSASQIRVAFASIDWNTGSSSPGELEMTFNTSEVAVCCSSASERSSVRWRSSLSSRVFSMAMTACAAKLLTNSICLVGERTYLLAIDAEGADQLFIPEHWHDDIGARAAEFCAGTSVRTPIANSSAVCTSSFVCKRRWRAPAVGLNDPRC